MYREESCCLYGKLSLLCIVRHETDKCLCSLHLVLIAVIEDSEAPDSSAKLCLSVLCREKHRNNFIAVVGFACFAVVLVVLLSRVPAKRHCQGSVSEKGNLISSNQSRVEVDSLCLHKLFQCLCVLGRIYSILRMLLVCKLSAVQVVYQSSGSLVSPLAAAVNCCNVFLSLIMQSLHSLEEILCSPGVVI